MSRTDHRHDISDGMRRIGLFPLEEVVLLPTERVPIHIFEERYKELIDECLSEGTVFGVVLAHGRHLRSVGTYAAVAEVIDRFDDGRLNVVMEGRGRFEVARLTEGRAFLTAEVEPFDDQPGDVDAAVARRAFSLFARVASGAGNEPFAYESLTHDLGFELATRLELDRDVKQELLELRLAEARLARLTEVLEARLL
jgi:Lon protease-like protein